MRATFDLGPGLSVTRLGFGAGRITGPGYWGPPADRDTAVAVLRQAVAAGVTLIDTADNYGPGVSEELIASALHPYPAEVVIATKGGVVRTGPDQWHLAGRPEQLRAACEASLRRLRLDCLPLYQLHRVDPAVGLADQLGTLLELRAAGKIQHIGLDTITADQLRQAMALAPISAVQNHYSVAHRADEDVLWLCERNGLAFLPYLPLAGGALSRSPELSRLLGEIASAHGATVNQIALAWLLHRSPVMLPTPGTTTPAFLAENLAAAGISLSDNEIDRITSARP
ncbi:aldo/keto reductase [Goodfellowiella coeruleoviolacea]|uniref:aldo/keto reductase n=1 Tax=Goodfellowiella coeruleoviolacea TaxID=334858 RepID=UPI0020A5F29A|nr:aldo/keto reductase [Goodfellowiella coeruleoviolacea]